MSRKPRIEFERAFCHVITRDNKREIIFRDDADKERFLDTLKKYMRRYRFIVLYMPTP